MHPAGLGVERGIQRKRAMPVVLKPVALGASRRQRQNGIEPVQRLDGGLFIHTEHGSVLRRIEVQAQNIHGFTFELGIVARQVTFQTMRLETGFFPDPMHGIFAQAEHRCGNSNAWTRR